jgi:hypothetical protein
VRGERRLLEGGGEAGNGGGLEFVRLKMQPEGNESELDFTANRKT